MQLLTVILVYIYKNKKKLTKLSAENIVIELIVKRVLNLTLKTQLRFITLCFLSSAAIYLITLCVTDKVYSSSQVKV